MTGKDRNTQIVNNSLFRPRHRAYAAGDLKAKMGQ
jgi:hypothetical protein